MAIQNPIATSDKGSSSNGSFSREVVRLGNLMFGHWFGYALVQPGVLASSLDVIIPYQDGRGGVDTTGLVAQAGSFITSVSIQPLGAVTIAAATGKLKFASALASATASQYAETPAATAGALAAQVTAAQVNTGLASAVTIGASDLTFKIYATDGGVGAAAVASTVTAAVETRVLVSIGFYYHAPAPTNDQVGKSVTKAK